MLKWEDGFVLGSRDAGARGWRELALLVEWGLRRREARCRSEESETLRRLARDLGGDDG